MSGNDRNRCASKPELFVDEPLKSFAQIFRSSDLPGRFAAFCCFLGSGFGHILAPIAFGLRTERTPPPETRTVPGGEATKLLTAPVTSLRPADRRAARDTPKELS